MPAAVLLTLILAQASPPEPTTAQIERIRRALTETPAITVSPTTQGEGTVFRVTIRGGQLEAPAWADRSGVPPYVRTWFPSYHHEFLERVTNEQFRAATLYPVGIPVLTVVELLVKQIKAANRSKQEADAKEEVRRALEELLACRANPKRPGC